MLLMIPQKKIQQKKGGFIKDVLQTGWFFFLGFWKQKQKKIKHYLMGP